MSLQIKQTTEFKIRKLSLISKFGDFDLTGVMVELNIFDSILMPTMSGTILINDSIGLTKRLVFDGSEYLEVDISKAGEGGVTQFSKTFRIYKQSSRTNLNQNTEAYILHFASEELVYSMQKKVQQAYTGTYGEIAKSVLYDQLKISSGRIGILEDTKGIHKTVIPTLSPIDTMNWLSKRAIGSNNTADYIFFENRDGFNFVSLSTLFSYGVLFNINFSTKNLKDTIADEFLGVRDFKYSVQFDILDNIQNGFFANKFIGFDILTRQKEEIDIDLNNHYNNSHMNDAPNAFVSQNRENKDASQMYDSRINLVPYEITRRGSEYVSFNDRETSQIIIDSHAYVPQRKAILNNLMQKKVTVNLPGNFTISSGYLLGIESQSFAADTGDNLDKSTSGSYLVIGTRHMIKPDKHETICELASDSTDNGLYKATSGQLQSAKNR